MTKKRKLYNLVLLLVLVLALLAVRRVARMAVYHPDKDKGTPCPKGVEDLFFASEDGTKLHGWLERVPGARRAVLIAHGNAGNLEQRGDELGAVARVSAAHVLMFDYRGYGRSEGSPYEAGVAADARAALAALEKATSVPRSRIVVFGHSLGGAVAIDLVSRVPDVAGLVVMSSFTSISDMARYATGVPVGFVVPESWDSAAKIPGIKCPKLIVHGDKDALVPFAFGYRLYELASEPKRFVSVQGADHYPLGDVLDELGRFCSTCAP